MTCSFLCLVRRTARRPSKKELPPVMVAPPKDCLPLEPLIHPPSPMSGAVFIHFHFLVCLKKGPYHSYPSLRSGPVFCPDHGRSAINFFIGQLGTTLDKQMIRPPVPRWVVRRVMRSRSGKGDKFVTWQSGSHPCTKGPSMGLPGTGGRVPRGFS